MPAMIRYITCCFSHTALMDLGSIYLLSRLGRTYHTYVPYKQMLRL